MTKKEKKKSKIFSDQRRQQRHNSMVPLAGSWGKKMTLKEKLVKCG